MKFARSALLPRLGVGRVRDVRLRRAHPLLLLALALLLSGCGGSEYRPGDYATVPVSLEHAVSLERPVCLSLTSGRAIVCPLVLLFPPRLMRAPGGGGYLLGP